MLKREHYSLNIATLEITRNSDGAIVGDGYRNSSDAYTALNRLESEANEVQAFLATDYRPTTVTYRQYRRRP